MKMIKQIALDIFWVCLFCTTVLTVISLWAHLGGVLFITPIIPTLFVIGLACFLVWFVLTLMEIRDGVVDEE